MPPLEDGEKPKPVTWMSLPHKSQLLILAICRLSEPLSNTCLLPYLYYLIRSLQATPDTSPASISRQAGLLVSLFALAQFATSVPWAHVANTWGRKPTIIIGLVMSIVANIGFGFSTTIPAVMCWRIVAGLGNGNIGVMRTMTAEIVKERKYQSRAFLLLPLFFNSGVVIGLALGGCLADPIVNLPSLFGPEGVLNFSHNPQGVAWMQAYPFALPTIFNAGALMCSLLLAIFGLKETMPGKADTNDCGLIAGDAIRKFISRMFSKSSTTSGYIAVLAADQNESTSQESLIKPQSLSTIALAQLSSEKPPSTPPQKLSITSRKIYTQEVIRTIISFALLPLHNAAFMQVFPVFLSTPPQPHPTSSPFKFNGGLGLPSPTIGLFLSAFGIFGILIQLLIYPSLQARLGTLNSYRVALSIFPLAYLIAPYISLIPVSAPIAQKISIAFVLFLQVTARTFGIPSSVILLTNAAPNPGSLAAVHGVGNMLSSLSRAVGPAVGGVVFGWGIEKGVIGTVWWGYLFVIGLVGVAWSAMLTEGENPRERNRERRREVEVEMADVESSSAEENISEGTLVESDVDEKGNEEGDNEQDALIERR